MPSNMQHPIVQFFSGAKGDWRDFKSKSGAPLTVEILEDGWAVISNQEDGKGAPLAYIHPSGLIISDMVNEREAD